MKTEIIKLLQMKQFFTVPQITDTCAKFYLQEPSQILVNNVHANWLRFNHIKSNKHHMPIYLNESTLKTKHKPLVYGVLQQHVQDYDKNRLEFQFNDCTFLKKSLLELDLIVPQQDAMQYLIQWQRYRKYWWSSISTTPSLFSINEFKYEDDLAQVDIVAHLPIGQQCVENLSFINSKHKKSCRLTCSMCLEYALFILLLDGLNNSKQLNEEYLKLHKNIAPFKIALALDLQKSENGGHLCKLATLLHHQLKLKDISTWIPDFSVPLDLQIKEILRIGVPYTVILEEDTIQYGILKLMNSSTKLMEQVHVADFRKYASLIFKSEIMT